jgi:protein ImuA
MGLGQMLLFPIEADQEHADRATKAIRATIAKVPATPKPVPSKPVPSKPATPKPSLGQLRAQLERLHSRPRVDDSVPEPAYSAGGKVLNSLLPHGGLRRGTIVQWVGEAGGDGAASLATIAAAEIAGSELSGGKPLVVFDDGTKTSFYPPAAIALGVPADRMVVVKKQSHHNHADMIWAIDQALRCDAVAAVWAELGSWLNDRDARRLQLAAEAGGTVGLFIRPAEVRRRPSFSDISWFVAAPQDRMVQDKPAATFPRSQRRLRVEIDRCRGGVEGAVAMVEIVTASTATATAISDRIVASKTSVLSTPSTSLTPIRSQHEPTMVSDLARRLAHPATPQRDAERPVRRDAKRAS